MLTESGYRIDLEDRDFLRRRADSLEVIERVCRGADLPEEVDPRPWHRIENQSSMGSCQGHAQSSAGEMCFRIATGNITQFSPLFAYYATQKIDGLQGRDSGSTIAGGAENAMRNGFCPADVMPYKLPYKWELPQKALDAAAPFKIKKKVVFSQEPQLKLFLGTGQGGIVIGIAWSKYCEPASGVIETYRPGGGGHAVSILGYSKRKDHAGKNYYWMANSWGKGYGVDGFSEISPDAISQMLQNNYTVMVGYSDLSVPEVRIPNIRPW